VAVVLLTLLVSCHRLPRPRFTYEPLENPEAGEIIQFINQSKRGESYFWEFGDGGVSTLTDPRHSFESAGIYSVTLTATAEPGEAYNTERITIFEPTVLGFIVSDSSGNRLEGASVWVYAELTAWENMEEPDYSDTTGLEGTLSFFHLEEGTYYIWAFREETEGKWYYRGYTPPLELNEENWFNVPCVWLPDAPHP
jgi:PKD repeat protein